MIIETIADMEQYLNAYNGSPYKRLKRLESNLNISILIGHRDGRIVVLGLGRQDARWANNLPYVETRETTIQ